MKMPGYVFKFPEEAVWLALGGAIGLFLAQLLPEQFGWSAALTGSAIAVIQPLVRFIYGFVSPTPTMAEAVHSVEANIDNKPNFTQTGAK